MRTAPWERFSKWAALLCWSIWLGDSCIVTLNGGDSFGYFCAGLWILPALWFLVKWRDIRARRLWEELKDREREAGLPRYARALVVPQIARCNCWFSGAGWNVTESCPKHGLRFKANRN